MVCVHGDIWKRGLASARSCLPWNGLSPWMMPASLARTNEPPSTRFTGFSQPPIAESDLIPSTTPAACDGAPKGAMITHRNAWIISSAALHHPIG